MKTANTLPTKTMMMNESTEYRAPQPKAQKTHKPEVGDSSSPLATTFFFINQIFSLSILSVFVGVFVVFNLVKIAGVAGLAMVVISSQWHGFAEFYCRVTAEFSPLFFTRHSHPP